MDLYAFPEFEAGGMENWGLILFRENYLFFDPLNHDEIKKRKDYAQPSLFDLNASNYIFLTLHDVNYHI